MDKDSGFNVILFDNLAGGSGNKSGSGKCFKNGGNYIKILISSYFI